MDGRKVNFIARLDKDDPSTWMNSVACAEDSTTSDKDLSDEEVALTADEVDNGNEEKTRSSRRLLRKQKS